jgi:hypothetical protein
MAHFLLTTSSFWRPIAVDAPERFAISFKKTECAQGIESRTRHLVRRDVLESTSDNPLSGFSPSLLNHLRREPIWP